MAVWFAAGNRRLEPLFAQICIDYRACFTPVAGFGATESRAHTHLYRVRRKIGPGRSFSCGPYPPIEHIWPFTRLG